MASLHDIWRGDIIPQSGMAIAIGRNSYDPPSPVVPVFDIHQRSAVLHDAGSSGIIQYNSFSRRLELIPSNSGAQSIVTAVMWEGYDATGGVSLVGSTSITLDIERINTHPNIFAHSGSEFVQINMSGIYEFTFRVSLDATSTTRTSCKTWLRRSKNGGMSFIEIPGARGFTYNRTTANGEDSATVKVITDVEAGYIYGLRASILNGGTVSTLLNGSNLLIRRLE